ncbi:unnamed protein product [Chrysoparadoxa australica]
MGAGASTADKEAFAAEVAKPLDASDIQGAEAALEEVKRLRGQLQKLKPDDAAAPAHPTAEVLEKASKEMEKIEAEGGSATTKKKKKSSFTPINAQEAIGSRRGSTENVKDAAPGGRRRSSRRGSTGSAAEAAADGYAIPPDDGTTTPTRRRSSFSVADSAKRIADAVNSSGSRRSSNTEVSATGIESVPVEKQEGRVSDPPEAIVANLEKIVGRPSFKGDGNPSGSRKSSLDVRRASKEIQRAVSLDAGEKAG